MLWQDRTKPVKPVGSEDEVEKRCVCVCVCVGVCVCVFCRTRATEALKIVRRWRLFGWVCVCVFVWAGVWSFNRRGIERWPQELVKEDAEAGLGSKRDDEVNS